MHKIIARGAEAVLSKGRFQGEDVLVKDRVKKGYRIIQLDEKIRKRRTKHEESLISRARRAGVNVPRIMESDNFRIIMEFVDGERVKDFLNNVSECK